MLLSDPFLKWVDCIRAEKDFQLIQAMVQVSEDASNPSNIKVDVSVFTPVAELITALRVIESFAQTTREHATLKVIT